MCFAGLESSAHRGYHGRLLLRRRPEGSRIPIMKRSLRAVLASLLAAGAFVAPTSDAQVSSSQLDALRDRLKDARSRIRAIQGRADSVADQIASIDEQAAAVAEAIAAADALIAATEDDISVLQSRIEAKQALYEQRSAQARDIAVELYKGGVTGELDLLLGSKRIEELLSRLEYAGTSSRNNSRVMVETKRLKAELQAAKAQLEVKLDEAKAARAERVEQAQHLHELRAAKRQRLVDLRADIRAERKEAEGLKSRSDQLEEQLREQAEREAAAAAAARAAEQAAQEAAQDAPEVVRATRSGSGFIWPLNGAVTSGYGWRWGRMHNGIDIDGTSGDPIRASRAGTVFFAGYDDNGYGNHVVISHGGGFSSVYAHATTVVVNGGQSVSQGQLIATVGCTGSCTGDHLHFEIRVNGSPQDPMRYLP
ncbi:MAG: peptidoglycan DD-metalloendopeptidase family protein [Actinobacteria bacterium]|nr:peptidoglycan DD-metalloendopeptidase family protein [Actinomycetota bacterium]